MKSSNVKAMIIGAALVMSACTGGQQAVNVEQPKQPASNGAQNGRPDSKGDSGLGADSSIVNKGSMQFTLSQNQLQSYAALDLTNVSYKFSYLTTTQSEKITFDAAGKAQLQFKNLEADKAGTLTLEILEGTTVKLRGVQAGVTLKKGTNNTVALVLKKVDGGTDGAGSTDLTIDVTLDDGSTTVTTPPADTTVTTPPADTTVTTPPADTTVTVPPADTTVTTPPADTTVTTPPVDTDPLADWDGKSFRGNAKFSVVPVEG